MSKIETTKFKKASKEAIKNSKLQNTLTSVMAHFDHARTESINEFGETNWNDLRERGKIIKTHTIQNLDQYLSKFASNVRKNKSIIHFADNASEVNNIVCEIVTTHKAQLIIKSKSMISEETGLNNALSDIGIETVETDLGEYIIQLADETPFHIIAPAMHKTKDDVSKLFQEKLGSKKILEIPKLANFARKKLRNKFLKADIGITGANFLVADTGTIVLVTNEGNGRMCTTLPKVHIAIAGMEKVIPSINNLADFLHLLPRAATGQRLTSYVSLINGPKNSDSIEEPEERHVIIVDNGRSKLLADQQLREALNCIRCGACLNICPVYKAVGGHSYGWVYPGPIGSIVTPVMVGLKKATDLPNASSLCGACKDVCPVKINIPHMLLNLRSKIKEDPPKQNISNWVEKFASEVFWQLMKNQTRLSIAHTIGKIIQFPFVRNNTISKIPFPIFSTWTRTKNLMPIAKKSFHALWESELKKIKQ